MTIEKGQPWGSPGALPTDGVVVRSDSEARAIVERARRAGTPVPALGLLGGDLCRTVGGAGDETRLHSGEGTRLPVDIGAVLIDGRLHWFVAIAHAWAAGGDLDGVLEDEELSGGDFVRNMKQLIDLLRQIADAAPNGSTRRTANQAADGCFRGLIAASSVVSTGVDDDEPEERAGDSAE